MTPQLSTKYVFTITVRIGEVTSAGEIGTGVRRIIPITGGEVRGEKVNGKVCPFGADFQIIRPNELPAAVWSSQAPPGTFNTYCVMTRALAGLMKNAAAC